MQLQKAPSNMNPKTYRRIIRASAIYDIIVTLPFAIPVLAAWNLAQITGLHNSLGFGGSIPEFEPLHIFFVNLMGTVVMTWSFLRVIRPDPLLGLLDGVGRFLFSTWMLYYLFVHSATAILWLFFVPEILWGIVQVFGYLKLPADAKKPTYLAA
jgi:hypothetical protein